MEYGVSDGFCWLITPSLQHSNTPLLQSSAVSLSVLTMATSSRAGGCARWRLFRMQIRWPTLRHVFFDPLFEGGSTRQSARDNVASERFGFHDGDVRLARNRNQIIRGATLHRSGRTEVKRHRNLVHGFSVEMHRPDAAAHKCPRFNCSA